MWCYSQNSAGCHNCECSEEEEAHPIEHHCGKLPVGLHSAGLIVLSHLVSDHLELLQDEAQLPLQRSQFYTIQFKITRVGVRSKYVLL